MKTKNKKLTLWAALAAMLLTLATACAPTATRTSAGEYIDDATVTTRVKAALANDPVVKARDVGVETFRGTVQLSGFVASQQEAQRAEQIARDIPGVESIKNDIRIKPGQ